MTTIFDSEVCVCYVCGKEEWTKGVKGKEPHFVNIICSDKCDDQLKKGDLK